MNVEGPRLCSELSPVADLITCDVQLSASRRVIGDTCCKLALYHDQLTKLILAASMHVEDDVQVWQESDNKVWSEVISIS